MDEKLRVDMLETTGEKEDILHIPNSMFDQNTASFVKGETMNRDYLYEIFGESMDFLNKDVRLTRTKHYEMREKVEQRFTKSIKDEKKKLLVLLIVYILLMFVAVYSISIALAYFQLFVEADSQKYFVRIDGNYIRGTWGAGGFFFGVGWMILTISTGIFGAFLYSTIRNIKEYKEKRKRALEILEEDKFEQMLLGLYDASR